MTQPDQVAEIAMLRERSDHHSRELAELNKRAQAAQQERNAIITKLNKLEAMLETHIHETKRYQQKNGNGAMYPREVAAWLGLVTAGLALGLKLLGVY